MPAITTTRVCASLPDLDHEWAIVAETVPACVVGNTAYPAGWAWHMPTGDVVQVLLGRDRGTVSTVTRFKPDGERVLYARFAPARVRRAA